MPSLHVPARPRAGVYTRICSPQSEPLRHLEVGLLSIEDPGEEWHTETGDRELVIDIFSGKCTVRVEGPGGDAHFPEIGIRPTVFAGRPTLVYASRDSRVHLFADQTPMAAAVAFAPARDVHPAAFVHPEETVVRSVGQGNWRRTVVTGVGDNVRADRLIVGETINPPGNWSSYPPHKHDAYGPGEEPMEEVYLYRLDPPTGFGIQRVYTAADDPAPFDQTLVVRDGDAVVVPRGYHPVVGAPGYSLFYLWVLAGDSRKYGAWADDPQHAWVKEGSA
ncbi:MAG TPA: 5-deoxy-glucuronate isomerase [Chthonomonadales bacterium]|nr:5-deoxy-glucuronate isomerase [Chthonomonadales bacterium]